jgi:Uma2 family endonuclease
MATVPTTTRRPSLPRQTGGVTFVTDDLTLTVPASAFTLDGFRDWATEEGFPERVRVTFIDGEITLDISNEEPDGHVAVKTALVSVLASLVRELNLGKFRAGGALVTNPGACVSNNPDAIFFTFASLEERRVRLVPKKGGRRGYREVEGTPDWVLEVVSDGSVQKDTQRLREAYHRAGVAEYWLIDARGDDLVFQVLHRRKHGYAAAPVKDGWQRSRVFGRSFRLERRRDDFGLWEYTLHVQDA